MDTSIIIATRNRADLLASMLAGLARAMPGDASRIEVIVVDSASTDGTRSVIDNAASRLPQPTILRLDQPGKARALNAALRVAQAPLLVFTDDDVEVAGDWLEQIIVFFNRHPEYAAAMGCVRTPPRVSDPDTLARVSLYGTLPLYDRGDVVTDSTHLYGCNMAIRRSALEHVGGFNEQLGPGASGLHEDGDMARRIIERGLRIGYMPQAIVYHVVEEDRLTLEFFREMHRRDARSRFVQDGNRGLANALAHWLGSATAVAWWTLLRNRRRRMKAVGRLVSHGEMLRLINGRGK